MRWLVCSRIAWIVWPWYDSGKSMKNSWTIIAAISVACAVCWIIIPREPQRLHPLTPGGLAKAGLLALERADYPLFREIMHPDTPKRHGMTEAQFERIFHDYLAPAFKHPMRGRENEVKVTESEPNRSGVAERLYILSLDREQLEKGVASRGQFVVTYAKGPNGKWGNWGDFNTVLLHVWVIRSMEFAKKGVIRFDRKNILKVIERDRPNLEAMGLTRFQSTDPKTPGSWEDQIELAKQVFEID